MEARADEDVWAAPIARKWFALHDAAAAVGAVAGLATGPLHSDIRGFPAAIYAAGGWRQEWAEQDIDDLAAVLEAGLTAPLALQARGIKAGAPATMLWHEFIAGRDALMSLLPPSSNAAPT